MWCFPILMLVVSSFAMESFSSAAAASQSSRHKRSEEVDPWNKTILPTTIEPTFYDLYIDPRYVQNDTEFFGNVSIDINVLNQTKIIIVHLKSLFIRYKKVFYTNGTEMDQHSSEYFPDNDYYVITTSQFLPAKARLFFAFAGNMTFGRGSAITSSGLYNIPYEKEGTRGSWLVVNDFRLIKARSVFPCFDEPRFKTPIKMTVRVRPRYTGLSNMPVEKLEAPDSHSFNTIFKMSPNMSIQNLGFAITDFPSKNKTVDGKLYRVFAQPKSLDKVDYALNVAPTIVKFLQEELDVPYPTEKVDQIAVPGELLDDLRSNLGLVMFSESMLLFNETNGDDSDKFLTLRYCAHALAHGYFDNLVTPRYWDHLWLTEGLATFYEIRAVKEIEPKFLRMSLFYGKIIEKAMLDDSKNLGVSLIPPYNKATVGKPKFIECQLLKAAAILRMLENFISPAAFKSGISEFLKKYANGTVVTDDLWEILREETGNCLDIKEIMTNWVKRKGIPAIKIELSDGNKINATQKQFLDDTPLPENKKSKWYVPLYYQAKRGNKNLVWMNKSNALFEVPDYTSEDWIICNYDSTGYYRVNYADNLWGLIAKQLYDDHTVFTDLSRIVLLSDAAAFARAEELRSVVFLNLTRYASKETNLVSWFKIYDGICDLYRIRRTASVDNYEKYLLNLTSALMDKYQVKDEGTVLERMLRGRIISLSCHAGHEGCIENSTRVFKAWIRNKANVVPEEYRREVYCTGIANSVDESEWTTTLERYRRSKPGLERTDLLKALACTQNVTLLERLLQRSLNTSYVYTKEAHECVSYVATNPQSDNCAWRWLKANHAEIDRIKGSKFAGTLLPYAVQHFSTPEQFQEVVDFYGVYPDVSEKNKRQAKGFIDSNIRWYAKNLDALNIFLASYA